MVKELSTFFGDFLTGPVKRIEERLTLRSPAPLQHYPGVTQERLEDDAPCTVISQDSLSILAVYKLSTFLLD